jgi:hypothetical protein
MEEEAMHLEEATKQAVCLLVSVDIIEDERMTNHGEVAADLVLLPTFEMNLNQ